MQLVLLLSPFTDGETDPESLGRLAGACQRRCQDSALGRERLEPTVLAGAGGVACCLLRAEVPLRSPRFDGELSLAGMSLLSHLPS